jgi:hypothetical protein
VKRKTVVKSLLFLKKKKQKDFSPFAPSGDATHPRQVGKVFWFFFSKKNNPYP